MRQLGIEEIPSALWAASPTSATNERDAVRAFKLQLNQSRLEDLSDTDRDKISNTFLSIYTKAARLDGILRDIA